MLWECLDADASPGWNGGGGEKWLQETISEFVDVVNPQRWTAAGMIRSGCWKLWEFTDEEQLPPSLFNLEEDPEEDRDLWDVPEYVEVATMLRKRLREHWDPVYSLAESSKKSQEYRLLQESVKANPPEAPHRLYPPEEDLERDVNTFSGKDNG